jgi:mannitol/fructose-specific phosphotransferase system IIA component (Ntr-type)
MMVENRAVTQSSSGNADINKLLSLSELLPRERVCLNVEVSSWQEAVREAGKLLLDSEAVTGEYIEAMIKVAEELGPYIVIAPGIALPHAATEAGAKQTALSLVKLASPINFGNPDNDPVRLVFGLSAIDKKMHMLALQTLAELFLSKDLVDRLFKAETVDSVMEIFQQAEEILHK